MGLPTNAQSLDLTPLAQRLVGPDAGGRNLEYEPEFRELEEEALGRPEVQYGDIITEAVEPNWRRVALLALPLLARSRDLRLAIWLTRAQLNVQGIPGLAAGLQLIHGLLENCWDGVHPQLDPDDDNDPALRINTLAFLCEPCGILRDLLDAPLLSARSLGTLTLRQVEQATQAPCDELSPAMLEGALAEADATELSATADVLAQALCLTTQIEQLLTARVGVGRAIDLSALATLLRRAVEVVRRCEPEAAGLVVAADSPVAPSSRGEIHSREDARQAIARLCAYFHTHEPASPVPILLQRASQLIDKNFIELLQDLAPDGLAQLAQVSGIRSSDN